VKSINGTSGSVDAIGLKVVVIQPGNAQNGVPSLYTEYIIGEGHSEGFSLASTTNPVADLTNDLGNTAGDIGQIISDTVTSPPGSSTGGNPSSIVTSTKRGTTGATTLALAGAVKPPFALWFFLWEASVFGAAAIMVWSRRRRLSEEAEG